MINSSAGDVAARVRELTGGNGAAIVFNTVGDPYYQDAHRSTAKLGRQILISAVNRIVEFNIFEFYRGRHTYVGIDTLALSSVETADVLRELAPGFAEGALRPFPIAALRHLPAAGGGAGLCGGARLLPRPHHPRSQGLTMHLTRFDEAPAYHPPEHFDMRCLMLQGRDAGPSDTLWLGMSQILPGGHTSLSASPSEKFYVVIEGELTIETPDGRDGPAPDRFLPHRAGRSARPEEQDQPAGDRPPGDAAAQMTAREQRAFATGPGEDVMIHKALMAGAVAAALMACGPAAAQTETKIGIGFGVGFLPMFIVDELDLVEKHAKAAGLDVKATYQRFSGSAAMQDAVLSGSVDMGVYGVPAMLIAWDKARNTPSQVFGIAGVNSSPLVLLPTRRAQRTSATSPRPTRSPCRRSSRRRCTRCR